jgi:hypothetical protein
VLSIINLVAPPFQKKCENCHVAHSSFLKWVVFIVMFVIQNQRFRNQAFFMVPLQPIMNTCYLLSKANGLKQLCI